MKKSQYDFLAHGHGKTAPWIDLVNSEEWDTFGRLTDHLNNPAWVPYFLRQWHYAKPSRASAPLAKMQTLRTALRKSCETLFRGEAIPPTDLRALNNMLNVKGKQKLFQRQNGLRVEFVPHKSGWRWILAEVARSFVDTVTDGESTRIKICRNDHCRWVCEDQTKGRTRS